MRSEKANQSINLEAQEDFAQINLEDDANKVKADPTDLNDGLGDVLAQQKTTKTRVKRVRGNKKG